MDRKVLRLFSLLFVLLIPTALLAAEPADPAQPPQAVPADASGCDPGQDLEAQIFAPPADPAAPASPFTTRLDKTWCGACLDFDCGEHCGQCGGYVYSCAPRCTPICWCYTC
jgi:hypothetical protein